MAEPTRGEFDLLAGIVKANQDRLNTMDDTGTKGVAVVQSQLTDLVKDVTELKSDVNARFTAHEKVHEADQQQRRDARRWFIGTAVAALASMSAIIALLIEILDKTAHP